MRKRPSEGSRDIDDYIARAPVAARGKLEQLRQAIRAAVPEATEVISYQMPGYSFPADDRKGMFAWFGLQRAHIGLYIRPPTIQRHRRELSGYTTTKSAVHLPLDQEVPIRLIQLLVRASARLLRERAGSTAGDTQRRRAGARSRG